MFMPSLFLTSAPSLVYQYVFSALRSCACMITFHVLVWLDNLDNFHPYQSLVGSFRGKGQTFRGLMIVIES